MWTLDIDFRRSLFPPGRGVNWRTNHQVAFPQISVYHNWIMIREHDVCSSRMNEHAPPPPLLPLLNYRKMIWMEPKTPGRVSSRRVRISIPPPPPTPSASFVPKGHLASHYGRTFNIFATNVHLCMAGCVQPPSIISIGFNFANYSSTSGFIDRVENFTVNSRGYKLEVQ